MEGCTAILIGTLMVISSRQRSRFRQELQGVREVDADAEKGDVGRTEGAGKTVIRGDLNGEMGLLCLEDGDVQEISMDRSAKCGTEADHGGLKISMWLGILTDFNCKALSAWLSCDDQREKAVAHKKLGGKTDDQRGWIAFLDQGFAKGRATFTRRPHYAVHGVILSV